jgi:hypothetical protein
MFFAAREAGFGPVQMRPAGVVSGYRGAAYATGAKCLLEWVYDKQIESKVYTPTA